MWRAGKQVTLLLVSGCSVTKGVTDPRGAASLTQIVAVDSDEVASTTTWALGEDGNVSGHMLRNDGSHVPVQGLLNRAWLESECAHRNTLLCSHVRSGQDLSLLASDSLRAPASAGVAHGEVNMELYIQNLPYVSISSSSSKIDEFKVTLQQCLNYVTQLDLERFTQHFLFTSNEDSLNSRLEYSIVLPQRNIDAVMHGFSSELFESIAEQYLSQRDEINASAVGQIVVQQRDLVCNMSYDSEAGVDGRRGFHEEYETGECQSSTQLNVGDFVPYVEVPIGALILAKETCESMCDNMTMCGGYSADDYDHDCKLYLSRRLKGGGPNKFVHCYSRTEEMEKAETQAAQARKESSYGRTAAGGRKRDYLPWSILIFIIFLWCCCCCACCILCARSNNKKEEETEGDEQKPESKEDATKGNEGMPENQIAERKPENQKTEPKPADQTAERKPAA